jgi:cytochrome P450
VGKGLLTSEGEEWRGQRKLIQPAFRHDCLVPYTAAMVEAADRVLEAWHNGDVRDIHQDMMRTTLDIVARTLLGCDASNEAKAVARRSKW